MKLYRCKCGNAQGIFRSVSSCQGCKDCRTSMSMNGLDSAPITKHSFRKIIVDTDDGEKSLTVCGDCGVKEKEA